MAVFTNQATLSYNDTVTNSNITTGELLEVLSVTKTAVGDEYAVNGTVSYVVSVLNTGTVPITGVTVTDDMGAYTVGESTVYPLEYVDGTLLYYVNGVLQATPAVTAGPPLSVTGITVPAGGNAVLVYEASVTRFAPPTVGGTVTNTATATGNGISAPASASETVTAESEPFLTISKSMSPSVVTENSRLTYTFTIQNFGNTAAIATDNAVITDTFDPILTDLAVTFNGDVWSSPANYTYDATTGLFQTVAGEIVIPAATFTQDPQTGAWTTTPGIGTLTVTGTV